MGNTWVIAVALIIIMFGVFYIVGERLALKPLLGQWEADFDFDANMVNQKQVNRIVLAFDKDGVMNYESFERLESSEITPSSQLTGHSQTSRKMKMRYYKKGEFLVVSMRSRASSLPFVSPFQMKSAVRNDKSATIELFAKMILSQEKLFLVDPESGKEVCFSRSPSSCHNAMTFIGEDGALAGYSPQVMRRRARGKELKEDYTVKNKEERNSGIQQERKVEYTPFSATE